MQSLENLTWVVLMSIAAATASGCEKNWRELDGLDVRMNLPESATVTEMSNGVAVKIDDELNPSHGNAVIHVRPAGELAPASLAEARVAHASYAPHNLREEALPDGWALAYETQNGSMTVYHAMVRRGLGAQALECATAAAHPGFREQALISCRSLKRD